MHASGPLGWRILQAMWCSPRVSIYAVQYMQCNQCEAATGRRRPARNCQTDAQIQTTGGDVAAMAGAEPPQRQPGT
eukprot:5885295-Pyramimonas_sp.AAC.1